MPYMFPLRIPECHSTTCRKQATHSLYNDNQEYLGDYCRSHSYDIMAGRPVIGFNYGPTKNQRSVTERMYKLRGHNA